MRRAVDGQQPSEVQSTGYRVCEFAGNLASDVDLYYSILSTGDATRCFVSQQS